MAAPNPYLKYVPQSPPPNPYLKYLPGPNRVSGWAALPAALRRRLEAARAAFLAAETEARQPATGIVSELGRTGAVLGMVPRVIESFVAGRPVKAAGEALRQELVERGVPGPIATVASIVAPAPIDPATYLLGAASRLRAPAISPLRPTARRALPVPTEPAGQQAVRQTTVPAIQMRPAPAIEAPGITYAQRVAFAPGVEGEVLLPRRPGPVLNVPSVVPPGVGQELLKETVHRRITTAAGDLFTNAGIVRDPKIRLSDQITMLLADERLPLRELDATLRKYGLSITEFANETFRPSIKDAARRMQALSAVQRRINILFQSSPADATRLRELSSEVDTMLGARSLWRAPVNIWRGLLVSQPATAARNFVTQVGRIGLDVLDQGIQAGLQRVTGRPVTASSVEPLRALANLFYRPLAARKGTETILFHLPAEWDRMFGVFSSDVATRARQAGFNLGAKDRILQTAEDGVSLLNAANRFQEFATRRAVFEAHLWQRMRTQGKDLMQIIARNDIGAVDEAAIKAAVEKSLEVTFARQPQHGTLAFHFVKFVNGLGPLVAPAIPFPRFMTEALRFYYEFSPFGLLKLLAPAERAALAAGNMQTISRAVVGAGMLGAAYAFRTSPYAGERWYQAKAPDGRMIDLRPFNPFSPYLFAADLVRRYQDGTLYRLDAKDLLQAFVGVSTRAGTGLYLLDQIIEQFTGEGKAQKALTKLQRVAGEVVSGFLTPLQTVSDVMAEFDQSMRVVRETGEEPFLGPIKSKIPVVREQLPEVESPTRTGPLTREAPLLRQLTGITLGQMPNAIERELDRLQFNRQEILPSMGDAKADRLIAKYMGPLTERLLVPFVQGPQYRRLTDPQKGEVLRRALMQIREVARIRATGEDPKLFATLRYQRRPIRERRLIEETVRQRWR